MAKIGGCSCADVAKGVSDANSHNAFSVSNGVSNLIEPFGAQCSLLRNMRQQGVQLT